MKELEIRCSFCNKPAKKVRRMISGPNPKHPVYICNSCVGACVAILNEDNRATKKGDRLKEVSRSKAWTERLFSK